MRRPYTASEPRSSIPAAAPSVTTASRRATRPPEASTARRVGRLGAVRQPNRDRTECLGQIGEQASLADRRLEGDRRALDCLDRALNVRGERDERMEGSDLAPGGEGGPEHSAPSKPLV